MFCRTDRDGVGSGVDMLDQRPLEAYGLARPRNVLPVGTKTFWYYHYEKRRGENSRKHRWIAKQKKDDGDLRDWDRRGDKFAAFNELRTGNRSCHRCGIQD